MRTLSASGGEILDTFTAHGHVFTIFVHAQGLKNLLSLPLVVRNIVLRLNRENKLDERRSPALALASGARARERKERERANFW
jgi:hypothetical protein